MKKSKGFTLVELLAVIVILAVILVIAIPNVMKIIDKARLDSYKRTEGMLVSAAQKYMAQQGITLNTVGDTTTVSYNTDLRGNKLIDIINDQKSKTECTNSRVIVTKTTTGYSYKPGLICNNYISLDTFNLVTNGDFSSGINNWIDAGSSSAITDGVLNITTSVSQTFSYARVSIGIPNNGDKMYLRANIKGNVNVVNMGVYLRGGIPATGPTSAIIAGLTNWQLYSQILTVPSIPTGDVQIAVRVDYGAVPSNGYIHYVDDVVGFNLTSIYGVGNEPSDPKVIDTLINKSR
jgi:type IV pilus assembly protein PilA